MSTDADPNRRRFLGVAGMTIAAAHFGLYRAANGRLGGPRDLAAIDGATEWINSPRLTQSSLAGKVVLVQFWTYTCINWLRTLPYVRAWAQKYRRGLVIVGVHTPEFAVEHDLDHVRRAVKQLKIEYPVVIDNTYAIWRAFDNQYWPALYIVDSRGRVRDHRFGEGEYERSEPVLQRLLGEAGDADVAQGTAPVEGVGAEAAADWANLKSPENYVGYDRTEGFSSPGGAQLNRRRRYTAPSRLALNQWALAGEWTMGKQVTVLNAPNGRIAYRFHARDLHLVMNPSRQGPVRFRVSIDGAPPGAGHGVDVDAAGNGTVTESRLYQLIRQPQPIVDRHFEIEFLDTGVETLAFTFG
jgi:thiol-disulfide isomerase/thioredoxin